MRRSTSCIYVSFLIWMSIITTQCKTDEFHCKPKLGCHIAACDPTPNWSKDDLNRNELPITCQQSSEDETSTIADLVSQLNTLTEKVKNVGQMQKKILSLEEDMKSMELEITRQNNVIGDMTRSIEVSDNAWCDTREGIVFDGTCLWVEEAPAELNLFNAFKKCNKIAPSRLPEFNSEDEYRQIIKYLRRKIQPGYTGENAWTGMTRNYWTGNAMLSNGELAPYMKASSPRGHWKKASISRTNVIIHASKDEADQFQGMSAVSPLGVHTVALLCHRTPLGKRNVIFSDGVWCQSRSGIMYNGSCLWAEKAPAVMNVANALAKCNSRAPSKLPDIYGGGQFIQIIEFLRAKIPNHTNNIFAWTGMKRNIKSGEALLSNGVSAPYTRPRSDKSQWTKAKSTHTQVYLVVRNDAIDFDQGMGSFPPSFDFNDRDKIVLCQKIE